MISASAISLFGRLKHHRRFWLGLICLMLLMVLGLGSIFYTPFDIEDLVVANRFKPVGIPHLLGTDHFGRDMLSLMMVGTRTTLFVGLIAVVIGMAVGVPLGLFASAKGGWVERTILHANDFIFAFPALISAILLTALLGPSATNAMIAIGIFNIPVFARVTRAAAHRVWVHAFIDVARLAGRTSRQISISHILPNIAGLLGVQAAIQLSMGILAEAGLSYVGLGTQSPNTSLGFMLKDAQTFFQLEPQLALIPGLTIVILVLSLNLMADALHDALNPKSCQQPDLKGAF